MPGVSRAADAKLANILRILDEDSSLGSHLMITTSDHGEHFGENRLMSHRFSVGNPVLHIPLVISGLPDVAPAIIDHPVELRQVRQSLLCWALGETCPAALPTTNPSGDSWTGTLDPIISIYSDRVVEKPDDLDGDPGARVGGVPDSSRSSCNAQDRVFGNMVSMIRYPMKITWYEKYEPVLHDLSWDPKERFDQSKQQPELTLKLREELESLVQLDLPEYSRDEDTSELSEEGLEALKSLGYIQ